MKHIAVVEDEALMREELADMLRRAVNESGAGRAIPSRRSRTSRT